MFIVTIAGIIFIQEGQRNVPVSYAKSSRQGPSGAVSSFLPIRVNIAGVIPIIFAMSLMIVPSVVAKYLESVRTLWIAHGAKSVETFFANHTYYNIIYFILVFVFTYFYTSVVFKPEEIAENLQKQSGYIPGIRPGTETKDYLSTVITRITLFGALFLGVIAILPLVVQSITNITTIALGGTGILIIVSVVVETMRQLESQLVMHTYDNY
jgi:preprotein translocase subunit SecY